MGLPELKAQIAAIASMLDAAQTGIYKTYLQSSTDTYNHYVDATNILVDVMGDAAYQVFDDMYSVYSYGDAHLWNLQSTAWGYMSLVENMLDSVYTIAFSELNQMMVEVKTFIAEHVIGAVIETRDMMLKGLSSMVDFLSKAFSGVHGNISAGIENVRQNLIQGVTHLQDVLSPLIIAVREAVLDAIEDIPKATMDYIFTYLMEEVEAT